MNPYTGEIAALATALCWTATSTLFTFASQKVGSMVLNRIRLLLALVFLVATHLLLRIPLPTQAGGERWFWLGLSGIVGLTLGDLFLFQAFITIGPRLGMLMMSLAPVIAGFSAWLFLSEAMGSIQILGVTITLAGVAWVVLERGGGMAENPAQPGNPEGSKVYWKGILFGLGAATGQALGLILAKKGLGGDFPALSGTLMRMLAATAAMWLFTFLRGQAGETWQRLARERGALPFIVGGVIFGPFVGVTLSLIAIQNTGVGVASTLMALPPVFLLPVGYLVFKERFGWQAVMGTVVAVSGVALLFLV